MISFQYSKEQIDKINEWTASHEDLPIGAIGGRYTYQFTPTSLGISYRVKDNITGDILDVTDYQSW